MSDRMLVMNKGKIEEMGDPDEIYASPQSEYTKRLIKAIPVGAWWKTGIFLYYFQDAIQYHVARKNNINTLLTRNLRDFKKFQIVILTAQQFIKAIDWK